MSITLVAIAIATISETIATKALGHTLYLETQNSQVHARSGFMEYAFAYVCLRVVKRG